MGTVADKILSKIHGPACLGLAFLLSSCATARVEKADATFTKMEIEGERLAIGPVVQIGGEPIRAHEAEAVRNQLQKAINTKRNYIRVGETGGANIIQRIGGTAESGITHSLRTATRNKGYRYLMLTELTDNCVSHRVDESCVEHIEDIVDEHGHVIGHQHNGSTFTTTSYSTRKIAARFKVLDLQSGKTVWVSRSNSSNSASNSSESCHCFPPAPPYPAPPKADGIAMTIARAAVRKLPRGGLYAQN